MGNTAIDILWSNDMRTIITAAALIGFSATAGNALSVNQFGTQADFLNNKVVVASEDFEGSFDARAKSYSTAVGTFEIADGVSTVAGNLGLGIVAGSPIGRDGRLNTVPVGNGSYLDSFDATLVTWHLALPSDATGLGFWLTDLDDAGGNTTMTLFSDFYAGGQETFDLFVPGTSTDLIAGNGNGKDIFVALTLGTADLTKIVIESNNNSDGWGIDGVSAVAPVPLPAAAWMLIAGIGALFGLGRRKAA
jgi:hypothetical protein